MDDAMISSRQVETQMDDVLATVRLVGDNQQLCDELFGSLVDLLIEHLLLEMAIEVDEGSLSTDDYEEQLGELAEQCRTVGLLV
jgi:hypothetical protein